MRRQVLRGVRRRDRFFCNDKFSKTSRCSLEVSPGLMTVGRALEGGGGEGKGEGGRKCEGTSESYDGL